MRQLYAINVDPAERAGMAMELNQIWLMDVDDSYRIHSKRGGEKWLAAIRTVSGCGEVDTEKYGRFELGCETLFFVEVSQLRYFATVGSNWNFYWFEFSRDFGMGFPWYEVLNVPAHKWEAVMVLATFNLLYEPEIESRTPSTFFLGGLLHDWALRWERYGQKPNPLREIVYQAISRMKEDFSKPLSMETLADELNINQRWFSAAFFDTMGVSPRTYYSDLRMHHAAHALLMGFGTITQIADRLGYSNPFHFSRAFKTKYGCSPSAYIRLHGSKGLPVESLESASPE